MASYTLIGPIGVGDGQIVVAPAYVLPSGYPGRMKVDSEIVHVTGGAGTTTISVDRGQAGTVKATHATGATLSDDLVS